MNLETMSLLKSNTPGGIATYIERSAMPAPRQQKVDEETNADTRMLSKMRRERNARWDYISHGIDVAEELDANLNFQRIHLMSHWVEQIC